MKLRFSHLLMFDILLICQFSICLAKEAPDLNESSIYLDAVRTFADNVLKYGRDTYGPKHTPLFIDGLMVSDPNDPNYGKDGVFKPVEWISPEDERWVLSNLASQQNIFRTLDGLTAITGEPKYKQAAMDAIEYAFENLRSPNGLLHWDGHQAYDAEGDKPCGNSVHELKLCHPFYELMWEVNPQVTRQFIEAFWSANILDWSNLEMNRHGSLSESLEMPWKHEYQGGPVFEYTSDGYSSISSGSDLVYAGTWLTKLSGQKEPLGWAKRLAHRYIRTRHPKTGISYWCYTHRKGIVPKSYDNVMSKLVPGSTEFPISEFPYYLYTNPISRQSWGYCKPTPGISIHWPLFIWQSQFLLGEMLVEEGDEFKEWALGELTAFGKASYRKSDNVYVPILSDGTNLEGYLVKEDGPLGPKGVTLEPLPAGPSDFWAYTTGYRVTKNEFMWEMAHSIAKGNEFGDIGTTPRNRSELNFGTGCSNPYALLAFLELNRATGDNGFLHMAKRIGDNILTRRLYKGLFVASNKHTYAKFDAIDSLVLLHLHTALIGEDAVIPQAWPNTAFFDGPYRKKGQVVDNQVIYTLIESSEPPMSLQEAAAIGDLELVRSLVEKGLEVDALESDFRKTPLHRAAMSGQKNVVEFLITKGAQIDAKDSFPGGTPLHYAVEGGHKEIVELLIDGGADVNSTRIGYPAGDTPLHSAVRAGHKNIIDLLITKKADLNAKNEVGQTPLDIAIRRNRKDIVELLRKHGANE